MLKYTIKRFLESLLTVLIVTTLVFLLMRLLSTDYYFTEEQLIKLTEDQKNEILLAKGLLDPPLTQLLRFYKQLIHLDFGTSFRLQAGIPCLEIIAEKFTVSMRLGLCSLVVSLVLGVSFGVVQAIFKDKFLDHLGTVYVVFVNAVPQLVTFSLILMFGAKYLHLPSMYSINQPVFSMILPLICSAMGSTAGYMLWMRRYIVDELNRDYIKLARVTGMRTRDIMFKHVVKNAFVPMAQFLPQAFLGTIGGSLLVERFFSIPGMGPLLADSIGRYDTQLVQVLVMLYASLGIFGIFFGDILMMLIDPRIRITGKGSER